jgi:hypothetical protein
MVRRPWRELGNRIARIPSHEWPGYFRGQQSNRRGGFVLAPSARHICRNASPKKFQPHRGGIIRRFPKYFAPERSWKIY